MQSKATTLQERFGFKDEELSTPKHDEIMVWLDKNIERILNRIHHLDEWDSSDIEKIKSYGKIYGDPPPPPNNISVIKKKWEHPILSQSSFTVGFIDMIVLYECHALDSKERPFVRGGQNGFDWHVRTIQKTMAIEVKPQIKSLGEVIRQVRMYESYLQGTRMCVCSPDDRFAPMMASQGIEFIKSPG